MCQEMNDHAGLVAACTSSGTLCTDKTDVYQVRDCLANEINLLSTSPVSCESIDECGVLSYGRCGEAIAISANQMEIASELTCRLSSCFTSLDYSLICEDTQSPENQFIQPVAACVNNLCVVQEEQK
jgi:hypothetical protein